MAFTTPTYDYGRTTNDLTTEYGLQKNSNDFGRFLSQERFRRGLGDAQRSFKQNFPKIGSSFNQRGMYHSGLRREGQREGVEDYQRQVGDARFEQGVREAEYEQADTLMNQQYQRALQALYENLQRARASEFDPYVTMRGVMG